MTERDPELERAWRELSRETPPPALDRAILAAAHRAVGSRPEAAQAAEATSPQRWWMPLAAAAAIGTVVVGILQTLPSDTNVVLPESAPAEKLAATAPASPPAAVRSQAQAGNEGAAEAPPSVAEQKQDVDARKKEAAPAARPALPASVPAPRREAPASEPPSPPRTADATARTAPLLREAPQPFATAPQQAPASAAAPAPSSPPPPVPSLANRADIAHPNAPAAPEPFPAAAPAAKRASIPEASPSSTELASSQGPTPDARKDVAAERGQAAAGAAAGRLAQAPAAAPPAPVRARDEALQGAPQPLAKTRVSLESQAKARDPDAWIARIRKLRAEGSTADAVRELREFRDAVPDAEQRLPADLREWASSLR